MVDILKEIYEHFDKIDFDKVDVIVNEDFAKIQISEDIASILRIIATYRAESEEQIRKEFFDYR